MAELELLAIAACVVSEAVTVELPAVLRVTLNAFVPETSCAPPGSTPLASLEVMATVSFVLITFQLASTALTVTLKAVPAVWPVGVPVLPLPEPATAVSPGAKICSLANAPALTAIPGLVFKDLELSVISLAVTVEVPAVRRVTLKVCVPFTNAAFAGKIAFASDDVIPATSVTLLTVFQFASTAFTVTL